MHTAIENDMAAEVEPIDKAVAWEAVRGNVSTIGQRARLDDAFAAGNVLFDYLWFLIVVILLILGLRFMGSTDSDCRKLEPSTPNIHAPANMR